MTARRRRVPSESNSVPLILNIQGYSQNPHSSHSSYYQDDKALLNQTFDKVEKEIMPRDRTDEFGSAVRSLQGRQIMRATSVRDVKKVKILQNYGEFITVAKSIGNNIARTYTKLEKLTLLVKNKPLFNDKPTEIQELSYIIKEDLKGINEQLARLQGISKKQNVSHQKNGHKHLLSHSNSVVISLQSKLANMSNEFKQVLDTRTQNLKQAKDRRDQFSDGIASPPHQSSSVIPFRPDKQPLLLSTGEVSMMDDSHASTSAGPLMQMGAQSYMKYKDETDQYLVSRADTMQNIESTIVELGGIFQQLAHMVKEQDEMVERIDTNIMEAELNVEAAHHQILKYFQSVTSNRWLMIKIFAVLMFFFTFFAVFLA